MKIYFEYYYDGKLQARDEIKSCALDINTPILFDNIPCKLTYIGSFLNTLCVHFDLQDKPNAVYNICYMDVK